MSTAVVKDPSTKKPVYFDVVAFGKLADEVVETTIKGDWVEVKGIIVQRKYVGGDGVSRKKLIVVAKELKKHERKWSMPKTLYESGAWENEILPDEFE